MARAREAGLDLVEVDANGNPPVCRLLDYGKWKYEQAKKERDARKHQRGTMVHEVRLRPRTGQHDIDLKVRIVERLLAEGDKVKLSVMFRGREMSHPEVGHDVLNRALSRLGEQGIVEKPAGMEGRFLSVILTPSVKKPKPGEGAEAVKSASGDGQASNGSAGAVGQSEETSASRDGADPSEEAGT
jgi:translation initiation factor IF-3